MSTWLNIPWLLAACWQGSAKAWASTFMARVSGDAGLADEQFHVDGNMLGGVRKAASTVSQMSQQSPGCRALEVWQSTGDSYQVQQLAHF